MSEELVLVEHADGCAEVVLNRPHRKNALTEPLVEQLAAALADAEEAAEVSAILIRGAEGTWCSGIDLKEADLARFGPLWQQLHRRISRMRTPIVGCLEGVAINAGAALALSCDVVLAGRSAYLQIMEAQLGMAAPVNTAWLLTRHTAALGAQLALTAEQYDGARLSEVGIAHAVIDDAEVLGAARELTARIAGYPKGGGAVVNAALKEPLADGRTPFEAHLDRLTGAA